MEPKISCVAIIGCGVIGSSWACLFLSKGLKVVIYDPLAGSKERFQQYLQNTWPVLQANGGLDNSLAENYTFVDDLALALPEVNFVQENGPEKREFKQQLMKMLDEHTRRDVVIASSSSGLPSSEFIQECRQNPSRILVGHPFNPPHLLPLVEVVPNPGTDATSISTALDFYKKLGKKPILLHHETPGFVANRLQAAINNEAYSLISRGIVSAEDLDTAVSSGPGIRWASTGPIVTNAFGGGGGFEGFLHRLERLGPSIQRWEEDMLKHRFDWSDQRTSSLKSAVLEWLEGLDWKDMEQERDRVLVHLLEAKSKSSPTK